MSEMKFRVVYLLAALMVILPIIPSVAPAGGPATAPTVAGEHPVTASRDREPVINYMNKTVIVPQIDGTWNVNEWTRAKRYDLSIGQKDQCLMYIGFDTTNTRIYIGIDVLSDLTGDTSLTENELVQISIDGENDGKITYKNKDGTPENETGEVLPVTPGYAGSCKDRWATITGTNNNDAGWLNLNGSDNSIQLWHTTPYYWEASDQMRAGFSGHRFYEYSIDYRNELAISAGASSLIGINLRVLDGMGDNNPSTWQVRGTLPSNYGGVGGPWAQFALAQAPLAGIASPAEGRVFYQNESISLDGSASTDDNPSLLVYEWKFDDGGTAANKTTSHSFATTGQHTITLNVTDTDGLFNITRATVTILEKNVPPVIDSFYPAPDPQVNETDTIIFGINVSDENVDVGDHVYINWTVDGLFKKTDHKSWGSNFTITTRFDTNMSAGTYVVAAWVQDTYDVGPHDPVVQSWTLTVQNRNRPPQVTASSPDVDQLSVLEGSSQDFSLESEDPDGDTVTTQWKLDNSTIPGTRNKGSVTYAPDFNSSGVHELKAIMTDSNGAPTERKWTVIVVNVNRSPRVISSSPQGDSISVQEGKSIMFTVATFDPDGTPPAIEWFIGDNVVEGANSTSFSFRAQYEGTGSSDGSPFKMSAVIRDKEGVTDERSWEVTVVDVNRAPVAIIDEPQDEISIRLGTTIRFQADRSWDPDSVDNSSLAYTWNFDDGTKTSTQQIVNHKFERTGNYTVRLTVRDRATASSALVSVTVVSPVMLISEPSFDPPLGAVDGKRVNIQVRVSNNGDVEALNVRVKLTSDNLLLTTLTIPVIAAGESQDVHWAWTAVAGQHVIRAALEPAPDLVIPGGGVSQKETSVKARPGSSSSAVTMRTALIGSGIGIGAAILLFVGYTVFTRRRKARPAVPPATPAGQSQRVAFDQMLPAPTQPWYHTFPVPSGPVSPSTAEATAITQPVWASTAAPSPAPSPPPAPASAAAAGPECLVPAPMPGLASLAVPAQAPSPLATAAPGTSKSACPRCGEAVESGWNVCPACSGPLVQEATAAAPVPESGASPSAKCPRCGEQVEAGWKACPSCGEQMAPPTEDAAALSEILAGMGDLQKRIEPLSSAGKDVSQVRGMLDLASSFHHTGKTQKAKDYLEKAKIALAELEK